MIGLGLGLHLTRASSSGLLNDYILRIVEDGGYIEGNLCAVRAVRAMPQANPARTIFESFSTRVYASGGYTEARDCTINKVIELI